MSNHILTPPANTIALMQLIDFVQNMEESTLEDLERKLSKILEYTIFLSEFRSPTESDIALNNTAFQHYHRMPQILEDNRLLIQTKTLEFQDALKGIIQSPTS